MRGVKFKMETLTSFSNCPNNCTHGYIINPYTRVKLLCKHCEKEREKVLKGESKEVDESIYVTLGLTKQFTGITYLFETLIMPSEKDLLDSESIEGLKRELDVMMSGALVGERLTKSYVINMGRRGNPMHFVAPFLLRYYVAGLVVAPFCDVAGLVRLRQEYEGGRSDLNSRVTYEDYLRSDVVVLHLDTGLTYTGRNAVKGLMQQRAYRGLGTVIITDSWGPLVSDLCMRLEDKSVIGCQMHLAELVGVVYKERDDRDMNYDESLFMSNVTKLSKKTRERQVKVNTKNTKKKAKMATTVVKKTVMSEDLFKSLKKTEDVL